MNSQNVLLFEVEWFDPVAESTKPFIMKVFPDGSAELNDKKTNRLFLKRLAVPNLSVEKLGIGCIVNIQSRQMKITGYANEKTRRAASARRNNSVFIFPASNSVEIGKALRKIEEAKFQFLHIKMGKISKGDAMKMTEMVPTSQARAVEDMCGQTLVALELLAPVGVSNEILHSCEGLHIIDATSIEKVLHLLFKENALMKSATFSNCALAIIRPHIVSDRKVGEVVSDIQNAGFSITCMELFHLTKKDAAGFFDVYRGVVEEYQSLLDSMVEGPCIALEVTSRAKTSSVVEELRETCGPHDPVIAKVLYPQSIRGRFGQNSIRNAVHSTDLPEDGTLESRYFFETMQG